MIDLGKVRHALRTLGRHPGFTAVAVLSLAVAIALNTTMYAVVDAMLNPRIAARNPGHVYSVRYYGDNRRVLPPGEAERALRSDLRSIEDLTSSWPREVVIEAAGQYTRAAAMTVRPNYFEFLGSTPLQGRLFSRADSTAGGVVVSDRLAEKLFLDGAAAGKPINVDGNPLRVIGVVERSGIYTPLRADAWFIADGWQPEFTMMRIRDSVEQPISDGLGDVDYAALDAQLKTIAARLATSVGAQVGWTRFHLEPFATKQFRFTRLHWALIGSVVAILLVACANLANLQLARGLSRTRELALRVAVGASRRQVIQDLVRESALLAGGGILLGAALTLWGMYIIRATVPPSLSDYILRPSMNWRVFLFAIEAGVLSLVIVGLLPAVRVSRAAPNDLLKSGNGTGASRGHRKRYGAMIIAQIGFTLPVFIGSVVLMRSLWILKSPATNSMAFDARPLVAGSSNLFPSDDPGLASLGDAMASVVARMRGTDDVVDAAAYTYRRWRPCVTIEDTFGQIVEMGSMGSAQIVTQNFFRTIGRPIAHGRDFQPSDADGKSVIIDAATAQFLWGTADPIGRMIKLGDARSNAPWRRVVGVLGDRLSTAERRRQNEYWGHEITGIYRLVGSEDSISTRGPFIVSFYARVRGNTDLAAMRLQRHLRAADNDLFSHALPLLSQGRRGNDQQGFVTALFATFGILGLCLVAIGMYGIVSYTVAERRRELAVRIAVGAAGRDILRAVLREGVVLILGGVAIGLAITKESIFFLSSYILTRNGPYDAPLFALIALGLSGVAAMAAFIPANRATRIDPVDALRHD